MPGSKKDSELRKDSDSDSEKEDFRTRAMAMYNTRGKKESRKAASTLKGDIMKDPTDRAVPGR
jgi:hypothetical protein